MCPCVVQGRGGSPSTVGPCASQTIRPVSQRQLVPRQPRQLMIRLTATQELSRGAGSAAGDTAAKPGGKAAAPGDTAAKAADAAAKPGKDGTAQRGGARPGQWVGPLSGVLNTVGASTSRARTVISQASQRLPARIRPGRAKDRPDRRDRPPGTPDTAGMALARLTSLPVIVVMAWLLPGLPLLLAGRFLPVPMLLIAVPLTVALAASGLRLVPGRWPRAGFGRPQDKPWTAWFGLLGTVAVAAGLTAWQLHMQTQSLIVERSPGAYLQTGYWLAQHGSLPIPQQLHAFGGAHPGLNFASAGFVAHGSSVFPAMPSGLPMMVAAALGAQHHRRAGGRCGTRLPGAADVRRAGGQAGRAAVGARRRAGARAHAARAVHQQGLVSGDCHAGAVAWRAVPAGRRADAGACGWS